ncbi:MAG TPA: MBL fold metallo-hydrolase [Candidatus Hydrogenedentes bacterium]|nr:MBL fold metallo-hydrolase [Candidatus Hydrogenedentota bacterium]HRK36616.1 MBL fold metallo-hydrolase [Candidatus Hydrogenedentota bacterium]
MIVKQFPLNVIEVNAHIAACEQTHEAVLIDAGDFDDRIVAYLRERALKLKTIFITHDHYDHVEGLAQFADAFGAAIIAGTSPIGGCDARVVGHGDTIQVGAVCGRIYSTPGHTPIALCLYFPGHVFTGDALFAGSVGGTSSQENYDMQIAAVREHILSLPPDTIVHPGHGPASTVAVERRFNPFFV